MTYSSHDKVLKQLENKPSKLKKWAKYNKPKDRSCGWAKSKCVRCGRKGRAHISAYGLHVCRQCFREIAVKIGFKKYS